jgi:hypothetical protein
MPSHMLRHVTSENRRHQASAAVKSALRPAYTRDACHSALQFKVVRGFPIVSSYDGARSGNVTWFTSPEVG